VLWRHRSSRGASSSSASSAASLSAAASGPAGGSLTEQLAELATADVIESQNLSGGIDPQIAPLWRPISLCGPAFTVRSLGGDNLAVHRALAEAPAGSVLVVESHGTAEEIHARALIGDIIGYAALRRGLAGLVTNAPVRDGRRLQSLSFPVYCCGRQIKGPTKSDAGELGGTVTLGGAHDGSNLDFNSYGLLIYE
jgi:4-hydroxy-4-methyl-2-oxoglutarate aldolase